MSQWDKDMAYAARFAAQCRLERERDQLKAECERLRQCLTDVVSTLEAAEELLAQPANENVELPLRDRNGRAFGLGVWFRYQVGTPHECKAILEYIGGVTWVRWADGSDRIRLNEFWSYGTDPQLTEVL